MRCPKLLVFLAITASLRAENFAIRGVTIHPVSAPDVPNAVLVVTGDRIADMGPKAAIPKGYKIIEGKGLHVYPGMIDSASVLGLSEIGSIRETQDITELGDFNPQSATADHRCDQPGQRTYRGHPRQRHHHQRRRSLRRSHRRPSLYRPLGRLDLGRDGRRKVDRDADAAPLD